MNRRTFLSATAAFAATCPLGGVLAQGKKFLTMDGLPAGTSAGQFGLVFAQIIQKALPIEIQISVGKPATKSALDSAAKKVDLFLSAPSINDMMQTTSGVFEQIPNAPELNANLRNILNYTLGQVHMVVYEDSGITKLEDLKGKKVFLGPPGGAATKMYMRMVEAATGLVADKDYEAMRYDFQSAETAFLDRQMDVTMIVTTIPSGSVQQYAMVSPIRLLGLTDEQIAQPAMQAELRSPGRSVATIPAGSYENQVNKEDVTTLGTWAGLGTNKWLDEALVYDMTKALWENIGELQGAAPWMTSITRDTIFIQSNIPLHAGAYRYYKEAGFDVPADQIPPEAK